MSRNIFSVALCVLLVALSVTVEAQQPGKIFRIGFLDQSTASNALFVDAFRQELSKLGWIEGRNITLEYRFAEGKIERLPELAADLVRLKVDLIVVGAMSSAVAAKSGSIMDRGSQQTDRCSRACTLTALGTLAVHWPEYLMKAAELGLYLFLVCAFATLLQHPASPVRQFISSSLPRRALYGLAMGSTVIGMVVTPWGEAVWRSFQSGNNLHLLHARQGEIVGRIVLRCGTIFRRDLRCCDRHICAERSTGE